MLTYLHFKDSLPPEAAMVALYAAVTDYLDDSRNAKAIMETSDRHMIMLESSLLSYALAKNGKDPAYPRTLVTKLSEMRLPHQVPGVVEEAVAQADVVARLIKKVKTEGKILRERRILRDQADLDGAGRQAPPRSVRGARRRRLQA